MYDANETQTEIRVESGRGGLVLARVAGEVDMVAVPALRRCIDAKLRVARSLVLDLTATRYFGAAGISALLRTDELAAALDVPWALAGSRAVRRPLLVTGLADHLPLHDTVDDAVAAVGLLTPA
ncbi:hypothetical protein BAY60_32575 [Prauserella muralis]|uniref:Uncharacterized protein n=1 Tax=Prauserella muralis TaxID=588067 RepID=A0A2V4AVB3_9PSEU|nr:hypothetical protein BAY60_32575 [Prauserella muralis]TWE29454.1 anti-anti-sigma factor [Prauserella muralis]